MTMKYEQEAKLRKTLEEEKQDLIEKCERQREMLKNQAKEVIDNQS